VWTRFWERDGVKRRVTMSGDVEARKLGEKLLLDVQVEGLGEV
jgi:hypothetical protein